MGTQKRCDRYYSRVRIPADLRQHINKSELVKSLQTTRYRVAKVRAARWESHVSDLFVHLRRNARGMTKQQIAALVRHYAETTLEECEADRASREVTQDQHDGVSLAITDALEQNDIDLTFNCLDRISRTTDELLKEQSIELDRRSSEYKR